MLSACASLNPVQTQTKIITKPEFNKVQKEELGNTLLAYYISNTQPTIHILENWGVFGTKKSLPPQILIPVGTSESISKYIVQKVPSNRKSFVVCFDKSDNTFFIPNGYGMCDLLLKALCNSGKVSVKPAEYVDINAPQFRQELIYNGKVGNNVKFLYREFSGNLMRSPFTQEVQYDLNEGNVIGFKGARIEILESSNRFIKYRVLKMFDH